MQELTEKGMVFDRFSVAYGKKNGWRRGQLKFLVFSAAGFGFGLISGTFAIVNVLSDMIGPGTMGIFGHSQDFFLATGLFQFSQIFNLIFSILAFLALAVILLHTCWGVIFFTSLDKGGIHQYLGPSIVLSTHMLFSCLVCISFFISKHSKSSF